MYHEFYGELCNLILMNSDIACTSSLGMVGLHALLPSPMATDTAVICGDKMNICPATNVSQALVNVKMKIGQS